MQIQTTLPLAPVRRATLAASVLAAFVGGNGLETAISPAEANETPPVSMTNSASAFVNWHQGFEHGTDGWYDANTPGPAGWCGSIEQVTPDNRGQAEPGPSTGRSHATVEFGACNTFWSSFGVIGAPYAPGPDLALYSDSWPRAGYVTELDIYLDPAWIEGFSSNFVDAGESPDTIIQYAATIFPRDYQPGDFHFGPHYFVNVDAGDDALMVAGQEIIEAGWYTFRLQFSDEGGNVRVDFELDDARGGELARIESLAPVKLGGPFKFPYADGTVFPTTGYGSGHVWFFDIARGIVLSIDEHRVRRGR